MHAIVKRTALSLSLVACLAAPALAAGDPPAATDIHLISAAAPVAALDQLPKAITVNGHTVTFDQGPAIVDHVLMLPVRAIAEAAGGVVTWGGGIQLVHVQMPDRTIMIHLSQVEAEMHQNGVVYLDRNRIKMSHLPTLVNDRTLIPADALTSLFGFQVQTGADGVLALTAPTDQPAAVDTAPDQAAEPGTIKELKTGEQPAFLLSGAPMANGEARLTWVSVTPATHIIIQDGDQERDGAAADLQIGSQVAVMYAGPLTMSYPAHGSAAEVIIRK
jgi:hypothetical protein